MSHPEILIALRRARDRTDRDFAQPLTLDSMAQAAHLSKFHFARAFARAYGETPRMYLTRRRIERAKDLLRAANLTITEINLNIGARARISADGTAGGVGGTGGASLGGSKAGGAGGAGSVQGPTAISAT